MRKRYSQKNNSHRKEFINSYHLNQVPLPYYNPLADPYLEGFFNTSHNSKHVRQMGLQYSPQKHYPYEQRRLINFNKFHRENYYDVPPSNLYKNHSSFFRRQKAKSMGDFSRQGDSTQSQIFKRMSESELLLKPGEKLSVGGDLLSQRPTTNSSRRAVHSSDGKARSFIFRKKDILNHRQQIQNSQALD